MRHAPGSTFDTPVPFAGLEADAPASSGAGLLARFVRLLALPWRVLAIRREMTLLGQMSGRELADIGLSRQDLWDAMALPFGQVPGPLFTRRVAERRRADLASRR